jgi:formylmethanofuran dehydrogenase subunit E
MSILGARLGLAARAALSGLAGEGSRLAARFYHRTCALDGIQWATNCTLGNGNIEVRPEGDHRLELWVQGSTDVVGLRLSKAALAKGKAYADLRTRAETLAPGSAEARRVEREMEAILKELEVAPDRELVVFEPAAR